MPRDPHAPPAVDQNQRRQAAPRPRGNAPGTAQVRLWSPPASGARAPEHARHAWSILCLRTDARWVPDPHTHEEYQLAVLERGAGVLRAGGRRHQVRPGAVQLINPGEVHTGGPDGPAAHVLRSVLLGPAWLAEAAHAFAGRAAPAGPSFVRALVRDEALAAAVARIADPAWEPASALAREAAVLDALVRALARHGGGGAARRTGAEPAAVSRAREYLHAHVGEDVSLAALGGVVGLSPYQLGRAFRRHVGAPPHAYHLQLRLARARTLLAGGVPIAAAALAAGFADQSHLYRRFRRLFGLTPGRFAAAAIRPGR
jgi:AraC-like DNA-binding protein